MTAGRSMLRRMIRRRNDPIRCLSKFCRVAASVVVVQLLSFLLSYPCIFYGNATSVPITLTDPHLEEKIRPRMILKEEQSNGRGAGNDKEKQHDDENHNNEDQLHSSATYNTQRHPNNYYYTNGNRISTNSASKSAYSYYDYNDDDSYYSSSSRNRNKNGGSNHPIYNYTTKLSDVYWCLLIALGWTIWMIHSIATLRQQQYNSMLHQKYNTTNADGILIDENGTSIHDAALIKSSPLDDNDTNKIRIFQAQYSSLLLLRGHVLDVLHDPAVSAAAAAETPVVGIVPTCTVIVDYVVERQQQPLKSPVSSTAPLNHDTGVTTLPTMNDDSNLTATTTEFIQIRKHFETSFTDIEVGFGNVEVLVLPNDPMCSMLKHDYDMYIEQEQRIQRVIAQEQYVRSQRRKKYRQRRKMKDLKKPTRQDPASDDPIINSTIGEMIYPSGPNNFSTNPQRQNLKNMQVDTHDVVDDDFIQYTAGINDDEDDIFGCEMCYTCCDCTYDQYQWKRLSLFFAAVLVIASVMGTVHVVSRMDPKKKYLGWISLSIGLLLLIPVAMYIHKVMILCHRWSDAQPPEKQGYIVQSSTMTGTITSYNNGDENNDNRNGIKPLKSPINNTSMMSLSDACLRPSCTDMMDDLCDPSCSNHTLNTTINLHTSTSCGRNTQIGFSYVVPEMSGCYFINYPTKDPNHRHGRDSARKFKHSDISQPHTSQLNDVNSDVQPPMNISSSSNHRQRSNNETSSIVSSSSISSISSNDDPKMQQLSIWNTIVHKVQKVGGSNDVDDSV